MRMGAQSDIWQPSAPLNNVVQAPTIAVQLLIAKAPPNMGINERQVSVFKYLSTAFV